MRHAQAGRLPAAPLFSGLSRTECAFYKLRVWCSAQASVKAKPANTARTTTDTTTLSIGIVASLK
jgi:hypothetical protein